MLRIALWSVVALGALGFMVANVALNVTKEKFTLVQWVRREGREYRLVGEPELTDLSRVEDLGDIPGRGPKGSRFGRIEARREVSAFNALQPVFAIARLGSAGAFLAGSLGLLLERRIARAERVLAGENPDL